MTNDMNAAATGRDRPPAVAGLFYPDDPRELRREVEGFLAAAPRTPAAGQAPLKALIVPHAGYVYSGAVAGTAYAQLRRRASPVRRVLLLGPAHRVAFRGLAVPSVGRFLTPLGPVALDRDAIARLRALPQVIESDSAHAQEHSLEVHLPFLQTVLGPSFLLVPVVVGDAEPEAVAELLELFWEDDETLVVVSSDLSHYLDYARAQRLDGLTAQAIERLEPQALGHEQACGRIPVQGLLLQARRHGLRARTLALRNSGDTAGPRDRVVGYGAWTFS